MKSSVWVLTYEVNDYNQHGYYFEAVFKEKPTLEQLMEWMEEDYAQSCLDCGGRRLRPTGGSDVWYQLREYSI